MPFTPMSAADYRALDTAALEQRRSEVIDLMNAETLPEGVTNDMLMAERDLIIADIERRNRVTELRNASIAAVTAGAGTVVATSEPEPQTRGTIVETNGRHFTDSREYREAFVNHMTHRAPMSSDMLARAHAEMRASTPVSMNADYTNMTDTFSNTISTLVPVPLSLSQEVAREIHNYGGLYTKVNQTSFPGGYVVFESDMTASFSWIGDKEVSPYHDDYDPEAFAFGAKQLEYRHARTLLAEAMMSDQFKDILAPVIAEGYDKALSAAILNGNGTTQPRGILTDTRLVNIVTETGTGGTTTSTNTGKATIVEVSAADIDKWSFWVSALYAAGFNGAYRNAGQWIMGDGTFGNHIQTLRDDNNRPIANFMSTHDSLNESFTPAIQGRPVNLIGESDILPGFDEAAVGDIFAVYGNLRHYTLNTQPGMPLTTTRWEDYETNTKKTRVLMACDGRVTNPFGWLLLKKKASA